MNQNYVWKEIAIRKPKLVDDYSQGMLRVDKLNWMIGSYNILMKSVQWWWMLSFHLINIACVNSYILSQAKRAAHPVNSQLIRRGCFDQLSVREELVQQLLGLNCRQFVKWTPLTSGSLR